MSPEEQLKALISKHCETLRMEARRATDLFYGTTEREVSLSTAREILQIAHKIAGGGGSMGFSTLSQKAFALEHWLKQRIARPGEEQPVPVNAIAPFVEELSRTGDNLQPEHSVLYNQL